MVSSHRSILNTLQHKCGSVKHQRATFKSKKHCMLLLLLYRDIVAEVFLDLSCSPGLCCEKNRKNKEAAEMCVREVWVFSGIWNTSTQISLDNPLLSLHRLETSCLTDELEHFYS